MSHGWGGLEMASLQWARLFHKHGHESFSIASPGSPLSKALKEAQLPVYEMDFREYFSPFESLQLRNYVKANGIQCIFLQSLRDLWVVSPAITGLNVHLIGFAQMWLEGINKKDFLHTLIHKRMDRLIALTPRQGDQVLKCIPFPKEKMVILPNSIGVDKFSPRKWSHEVRQQLGAEETDILVGIVGRLDPQKGQKECIEAFAKLRKTAPAMKIKLAVVGGCTPDSGMTYLKELEETVRANNLQLDVVFAGHRDDIPTVMASLDVFVLNSYREAFGFVLVEAMMSGTAVVATNSGGVPDVLRDGKFGTLVPPRDTDALAEALKQLALDSDLRSTMSEKARGYALWEYDEEKTFMKMTELLQTLETR